MGDMTEGSRFWARPGDTAAGGGGNFLSLISRTAPSALIAGAQRQPEVKGEWLGEQHLKRGGGIRPCLYRLGYMK